MSEAKRELLPPCFTQYPHAVPPYSCEACPFIEKCKACLRRDALVPLLQRLIDLERRLRAHEPNP